MTDIEAKALALVNAHPGCETWKTMPGGSMLVPFEVLCRVIEREAATEARHAAELREQAERFSEVLVAIRRKTVPQRCHDAFDELAAPFIIPAPDPLVESAREMTLLDGVVRTDNQKAAIREGRAGNTASDDFYDRLRTALASRQYEVRKIGEAK